MVTGFLRWVAVAVVAVVAVLAFRHGGMRLLGAVLGLAGIGLVALRVARGASRSRASLLHDPAVSTLVFPPEARSRQAVRPPR